MKKLTTYLNENLREDFQYDKENECNIFEMARMDDTTFRAGLNSKEEIWVYGLDRKNMTPHFHYKDGDEIGYDKHKHKEYELEISIEDLEIINIKHDVNNRLNNIKDNWKESSLYKHIYKWLNTTMPDTDKTYYWDVKREWNKNNANNIVPIPIETRMISTEDLKTLNLNTEGVDLNHSFCLCNEKGEISSYIIIGNAKLQGDEYTNYENLTEIKYYSIENKNQLNKIIAKIESSFDNADITLWYKMKRNDTINDVTKNLKGYYLNNAIVIRQI